VRIERPPRKPGELRANTSASQLKDSATCPRLWWYRKVARIRQKTKPYMALGTKNHKALEEYLTENKPLTDPLLWLGVLHLPPPRSPSVYVEQLVELEIPGSVPLEGYIDVFDLRALASRAGLPRVIDHKFSSNIDLYCMQPSEYDRDPQMVAYGVWACRTTGAPAVILEQHCYQRPPSTPKFEARSDVFTHRHLEEQWAQICVEEAQRQMGWELLPEAAECPGHPAPNHPSCVKYGGCDFVAACTLINGGPAALFAGMGGPTNESKMPQDHEFETAFARLSKADQDYLLASYGKSSAEALASCSSRGSAMGYVNTWLTYPSLETVEQWLRLVPESARGHIIVAALHAGGWTEEPVTKALASARVDPHTRASAVAVIQEFLDTTYAQHAGAPLRGDLAAWGQYLLPKGPASPPDAAPNSTTLPPVPTELVATSIPKLGPAVRDALASAMGLPQGTDPALSAVLAWVARVGEKAAIASVHGFSKSKLDAMREAMGGAAVTAEPKTSTPPPVSIPVPVPPELRTPNANPDPKIVALMDAREERILSNESVGIQNTPSIDTPFGGPTYTAPPPPKQESNFHWDAAAGKWVPTGTRNAVPVVLETASLVPLTAEAVPTYTLAGDRIDAAAFGLAQEDDEGDAEEALDDVLNSVAEGMALDAVTRNEDLNALKHHGIRDAITPRVKPDHYHLPGLPECIELIENKGCNAAMATKYLYRAQNKDGFERQLDLRKAMYYAKREALRSQRWDYPTLESYLSAPEPLDAPVDLLKLAFILSLGL